MMLRLALMACFALVLAACAQNTDFAERETTVNTIGTIREIDKQARTMVLRIDGRTFNITASEQVVNFDQLEAEDRVRVQYRESVAVQMALPGEEDVAISEGMTVLPPEGGLPGVAEAEFTVLSATFLQYDQDSKRALLELPDGTFLSAYVERPMRDFARARVRGDQILIASSTALLVSVEPAE